MDWVQSVSKQQLNNRNNPHQNMFWVVKVPNKQSSSSRAKTRKQQTSDMQGTLQHYRVKTLMWVPLISKKKNLIPTTHQKQFENRVQNQTNQHESKTSTHAKKIGSRNLTWLCREQLAKLGFIMSHCKYCVVGMAKTACSLICCVQCGNTQCIDDPNIISLTISCATSKRVLSRLGGLKIANRRFEMMRANRSHVMKVIFCESICANRIVANRQASQVRPVRVVR